MIAALIGLLSLATIRTPAPGNTYLFCIGINKYPKLPEKMQLSYAVADTVELTTVLKDKYGCKVLPPLLNEEATKEKISVAIASIGNNMADNDRLIVYVSGHGITMPFKDGSKKSFFLPYDADVFVSGAYDLGSVVRTCIRFADFGDYLDSCPAKQILLLTDACFSGSSLVGKSPEETPSDIDVMMNERARVAITGGDENEQNFESPKLKHGIFTFYLIDQLKHRASRPPYPCYPLAARLKDVVKTASEGRQNPQIIFLSQLNAPGQFVFFPASTAGGTVVDEDDVATLKVQSNIPRSSVVVNNGEPQATPLARRYELKQPRTKELTVTVQAYGYKTKNYTVNLEAGKTTTVDAVLVIDPSAGPDNFPDMPENHWAYEALARLKNQGIIVGYPDGLFRGQRPVTRYEMVQYFSVSVQQMLRKGLTFEFPKQLGMPPDVPENSEWFSYVEALAKSGLLPTYPDGLFRGNRPASRYELAIMIGRLLPKTPIANPGPPDVPESFAGDSDESLLPKDTKELVDRVVQLKIMNCYPDGLFRGKRPASRYECAAVIDNLLRHFEQ